MVREVVREELKREMAPVRNGIRADLASFKEEVLGEVRDLFKEFRSDLAVMKVEVLGELQKFRDEMAILGGDHQRLLDLEDKVDELEKIHPQGQHPQA